MKMTLLCKQLTCLILTIMMNSIFLASSSYAEETNSATDKQIPENKPANVEAKIMPSNWYDNFMFKDKSFTFEFIRTLGYAYSGGADLGEAISTAKRIKDGDIHSWYQEWLNTGNYLSDQAQKLEKEGDKISASSIYMRASNYFRTAAFYMDAPTDRSKSISVSAKSKDAFLKAISIYPFIEIVHIPYEGTLLPGYFIRSSRENAPLLIIHTGFDGTAEELFLEAGKAAYSHGYNVLLFEGPGQGEVLRKQNIPMRYDWEKVVTPVIDYAEKLPNVDKSKIALMGISLGGYLAARACAFDDRIKACIVNGGILDASEAAYKNLPPELLELLNSNPEQFNQVIYEEMKKGGMLAWYYNHAMWVYGVKTPAEVMKVIKQYNLKDVVGQIKSNMLVVNSEADMFDPDQAKKFYDLLKSPKTFMEFTRKQSAQAHCQMGAIAISNELILNWLDNAFNNNKADTKKKES